MYCKLCNNWTSGGINLSDGSVIHQACLNSLQNKETKAEAELTELRNKKFRLNQELLKRERIGFKIVSIFSKPKTTLEDISKSISNVIKEIDTSSTTLQQLKSRLSTVYDYFLSYPPDWEERKQIVISRDGNHCSNCERRDNLHLHHVIPLSRGGSNKPSNLELLCAKCHSKEHGGKDLTGDFEPTETAFSDRVSKIRYAIQQHKRIEFGYRKPGEKSYKKRTIRPMELINLAHHHDIGSTLCVSGYCELRKANRKFALRRMRGLKVL